MAINERLIHTATEAAAAGNAGEEGLILHLDASDVDSFDGNGNVWYDITNHEYTPTVDPSEHFNTVTYSGTGATNSITGVGFQPDLVWIKNRGGVENHYLLDSVRGKNGSTVFENVYPNLTNAQANDNAVTSLDSDGFTLQASGNGNVSGQSNVAWCFKAGGAAASNTDGSITSQVSANNDLGFSIATYTGNGSTNQTVGNGLDVPADIVIVKKTSSTGNWISWWRPISSGNGKYIYLDLSNAVGGPASTPVWDSANTQTNNTAGVFGINNNSNVNANNQTYVAYSFASKRGVSKVGSYTGTGSTTKVYTGFEPAFVMIKRSDASGDWAVYDNKRGGTKILFPHLNYSESTYTATYNIEFNSDGFSIGSGYAASGGNYIYLAFAAEKADSLIDDTNLELHLDAGDDNSYSGSGSTWSDLANSNDGTISGASWDKELGNWFNFDGVNDVVTTTYDIPSSGAKTIEIWFNAASSQSDTYCGLMGGDNETLWLGGNITSSYSDESIYWYQNPSELGLVIRDGQDKYLDNKWHHLVIVDTGSAHKMYLDGENKSFTYSYGSASTRLSADNIKLGRGYNADFMTGKIGQFRIYSSALSADDVMQNYRFTKNDYPNGFNGTFNGLTASDWNSNGYFDFPTGSDRIDLDFDGIDFNQTLVMWVNLGANTTAQSDGTYRYYLYNQHTGSNYQYFNVHIYEKTSGNTLQIHWRDSSSSYYFLEDDIDSDFGSGWNMIAVYIAGTESVYYSINGNDWAQATVGYGDLGTEDVIPKGKVFLSGYKGNTSIGSQSNPFSMSQFKVYDKVLTSSELSALNTAGYQG